MLLSKCAVCNSKISRYIKKQEVNGILSSLNLKKSVGILFWMQSHWIILNDLIVIMTGLPH